MYTSLVVPVNKIVWYNTGLSSALWQNRLLNGGSGQYDSICLCASASIRLGNHHEFILVICILPSFIGGTYVSSSIHFCDSARKIVI